MSNFDAPVRLQFLPRDAALSVHCNGKSYVRMSIRPRLRFGRPLADIARFINLLTYLLNHTGWNTSKITSRLADGVGFLIGRCKL